MSSELPFENGEDSLSEAEAAGLALYLASKISKATDELEALKLRIRAVAQRDLPLGASSISFKGCDKDGRELGDVTVTFPKPSPALVKSFNPSKVEALLGKETFDLYFETKVVLKKGALDTLRERKEEALATLQEVDSLFSAVDMTEPTARVGFRPLPSNLSDARFR